MQQLPPPYLSQGEGMTPAEALALRVQAGDDDAAAQLVRDHARLAYKLGLRWRRGFDTDADWQQACLLGLLVAARTWDASHGAALATWVSVHVTSQCSLAARRERWYSGTNGHRIAPPSSLDVPAFVDDDDERTRGEMIPDETTLDPHAAADLEQRRRLAAGALQNVTLRERRVLLARAGYGSQDGKPVPLRELAVALSMTGEAVRKFEQTARRKVRRVAQQVAEAAR